MDVRRFLVTSAIYLSLAGAALPEEAQAAGREGRDADAAREVSVGDERLRFTVRERAVLDVYAQELRARRAMREAHGDRDPGDGRSQALPPGLQKKVAAGRALPPGWQRKLARGEVLAPELRAAGSPLPAEVSRRLPAEPAGTVILEIDGELVRVIDKTRRIVDILGR